MKPNLPALPAQLQLLPDGDGWRFVLAPESLIDQALLDLFEYASPADLFDCGWADAEPWWELWRRSKQ